MGRGGGAVATWKGRLPARYRDAWSRAKRHRAERVAAEPAEKRFARYHRLGDDAWHRVVLDSISGRNSLPMPGFPANELQAGFVGSSNRRAIDEGWTFYMLVTDERRKAGLSLGRDAHVLDFGCGWGRYARMFLRDVPEDHIWCADTWDLALQACRETGVPGQRVQLPQMPPSDLPSDRFDLVVAYSVFSHLSPDAHAAWAQEFARVVRPGGLAFVTTQARWFLDDCKDLRDHPEKVSTVWQEHQASSFVDYERSLGLYDQGSFLFSATGGAGQEGTFYGEAVVPRAIFDEKWGGNFDLVDFVEDRARCPQAVAILRRHR
jgi:SAM-dependent methyltransferase